MENVIKIYPDRVLVEKNGEYYEKPVDTLEKQVEEKKKMDSMFQQLGMAKPD